MFRKKKVNPEEDDKFAPKVIMWAVIDNEKPDEPVTFTATRHDAVVALDQYLYLKHYAHFRLWCQVHDCKIDHGPNWVRYSKAVIEGEFREGDAPLYTIIKVDYDPNVIASLLRSYNRCIPMGCPFDTDEELDDYSAYFSDKTTKVHKGEDKFTHIEEALNLLFEDLEEENCRDCDDKHCEHNPDFTPDGTRNDA